MGREQDQKLVEAYENVIREAYTKGFKVGDKFIYQGDNKLLKGKKGVVTEVGVGQIKFQFDHLKKDQEKTLETEGMLKSKAWKKLSEATNVTAKNLKKGMNIPKFGKVDNISKQGHIVIVYSGKTKKKYDENESVRIDESISKINEGKKRYREQHGIGKAKYTVSFHDGKQKHKDGSDFFGMKIFKNKKALNDFITELEKKGYLKESIGMVIGTPLTRRGEATPTQDVDEAKDWSKDPWKYRQDLVNKLEGFGAAIDNIYISDRYFPGDVDHDKAMKRNADKAFSMLTTAIDKLETVIQKVRRL